jgi:hypothetical protein
MNGHHTCLLLIVPFVWHHRGLIPTSFLAFSSHVFSNDIHSPPGSVETPTLIGCLMLFCFCSAHTESLVAVLQCCCTDDSFPFSFIYFIYFVCLPSALKGRPTGTLPHISERMENFNLVSGSKYARAAMQVGAEESCKADKTC